MWFGVVVVWYVVVGRGVARSGSDVVHVWILFLKSCSRENVSIKFPSDENNDIFLA